MQGDCSTAPPAASELGLTGPTLASWRAPQCVIVIDHSMFRLFQPLWMDALYLRLASSRVYGNTAVQATGKAELFATRLTVQGPGPTYNFTAVRVEYGAKAYITGVHAARYLNHR